MSTKEKIYQLIDGLSEEQLNGLLTMLKGYSEIVEEARDDAYCAELYEEAKNDASDETKPIEDFAKELGINIA
ncbi:MAG: hypothetical protein IJG99_05335 [Ruminococcus sp.]|nr:hypothetical protein [Ruminococcus sp.]